MCADAHVGPRIGVPEGPGLSSGGPAGGGGDAEAALLLLRPGLQEQHQPPQGQAPQGLPDTPDPLQAEARGQALRLPEVRPEVVRCQG